MAIVEAGFYEIPGGELHIVPLLEGHFLLKKRIDPSIVFTEVAVTENFSDLLTAVIEHTISNTIAWQAS